MGMKGMTQTQKKRENGINENKEMRRGKRMEEERKIERHRRIAE